MDETSGLRLPRKFVSQRFKPPSPKDTTPIILNGNPIDRSDLTPIVEDRIIKDQSPKINLLETPEAVNDLFIDSKQRKQEKEYEDQSYQTFQEYQSEKHEYQEEDQQQKEIQDNHEQEEEEQQVYQENQKEEEQEEEQEEENLSEIQNYLEPISSIPYRKFNPPFPDQSTSIKQNKNEAPSTKQISVTPTQISNPSNRFAYVSSVESTDESASGFQKSPKITSPTDITVSESRNNFRNNNQISNSKTLVQTQLNPIRLSQQQSIQNSTQQTSVSSPPSPKLVRQEQSSPTERNQERIHVPTPPSSGTQNFTSSAVNDKNNQELIGKAHDCYLKYQILQKSWPEYKFPNLDEKMVYSNPQFIVDTYNKSVERIQIDMDVNQYKIALIIMFLVIEVVCVKFLGLDAGGYTLSQIKAMNRYEKLLIEIGEKRLLTGESSWPPEVRILFIGLLNCGLFILMKYLSSVLGPELVGYISPIVNGLFSGVLDTSKTANLPDEIPQRQQDITGMLGSVASMAASALSGNGSSQQQNYRSQPQQPQRASRRPVYRE